MSLHESFTRLAALNGPFTTGQKRKEMFTLPGAAGPIMHFELESAGLQSSTDQSCFGSKGPSQSRGVCRAEGTKFPSLPLPL